MERRRPRTPGAPGPGIVYPAWARSSVAERGTFNPCVVGSNPTGLTTTKFLARVVTAELAHGLTMIGFTRFASGGTLHPG